MMQTTAQMYPVRVTTITQQEQRGLRADQTTTQVTLVGDGDYTVQTLQLDALNEELQRLFQRPGQKFLLALLPLPE